ncbi:hypothetical protein [Glutamicibacter uratoxydans]|uniref:hypothetical protein n=1 Tax=Glutamicibacter uratoxydans TaxID=43667 RepID=UPI003D6E97A0
MREGRAAHGANEAMATAGLMKRFDLSIGDQFTTNLQDFTITGVVRDHLVGDWDEILFLDPTQLPAENEPESQGLVYYLLGEQPPTWELAKELNKHGVVLTAGSIMLNPPSEAEFLAYAGTYIDGEPRWVVDASEAGVLLLLGLLALLEVGLLAGTAFAVGARQQQRDLALLAVSGAEAGMLRLVVTAGGIWLGTIAGILGASLGVATGSVWVWASLESGDTQFGGIHIPVLGVLGMALIAVTSGVCAAAIPARAVALQAAAQALKPEPIASANKRNATQFGWFLLGIGALALLGALFLALLTRNSSYLSATYKMSVSLVIFGAVALLLGLIFLVGSIVQRLSVVTDRLPLALRLALRDANRNRNRTVPAVAAVLAAVTLSSALTVFTSSALRWEDRDYQWSYHLNQGALALEFLEYEEERLASNITETTSVTLGRAAPADLLGPLQRILGPNVETQVISGSPNANICTELTSFDESSAQLQDQEPCLGWGLLEPEEHRCVLAPDYLPVNLDDWRCQGAIAEAGQSLGWPGLIVGGEEELKLVLGQTPSFEALQMLRHGGAVISNPVFLTDSGQTTVFSYDPNEDFDAQNWEQSAPERVLRPIYKPVTTQSIPAMVEEPQKPLNYFAVISPQTAKDLGIPVAERSIIFSLDHTPNNEKFEELFIALHPFVGEYGIVDFESGPPADLNNVLWFLVLLSMLVTLGAAGITAGLALADGQQDQAVLSRIGADHRLRKRLSAAQALLTAALGTLLGIVAGTVPMLTLLGLTRELTPVIPWLQLTVIILVVPLAAAGAAWLLTRGRLPSAPRQIRG